MPGATIGAAYCTNNHIEAAKDRGIGRQCDETMSYLVNLSGLELNERKQESPLVDKLK